MGTGHLQPPFQLVTFLLIFSQSRVSIGLWRPLPLIITLDIRILWVQRYMQLVRYLETATVFYCPLFSGFKVYLHFQKSKILKF